MGQRNRVRPTLEAMEPKQLLSTLDLDGSARGIERSQEINSPAMLDMIGTKESIAGVGLFGTLGEAKIWGDPMNKVEIANRRGTLTLQLVPTEADDLSYAMTRGTGAYQGAQGRGRMTIASPEGGSLPVSGSERVWIQFTSTPEGA